MSLISLNNLSVTLQQNTILSAINLTLAAGDILGLVGPSGCGKTTLLNTIAGFITQNQGSIQLNHFGEKCTINAEHCIPPEQRNIGMIFQDYALFPHLTVAKNICFGIAKQTKPAQEAQLSTLLKLLKLDDLTDRYPHQLSGGQQQRVAIARALAPKPALLLLDEPFSNIDARLRNDLMIELRSLLKTLKITAIFVTHNKNEVFSFGDKIAVMAEGKILQTGAPTEVCQQPSCWQVADFLQLGAWLPITALSEKSLSEEALSEESLAINDLSKHKQTATSSYHSALGLIKNTSNSPKILSANKLVLLVKPQHIALHDKGEKNARVEHIAITEQGYHYQLSSINAQSELAFSALSFYSNELLSLGENISITVEPSPLLIFNQE